MLHIVTPISRPENLEKIHASIRAHVPIEYRWWCVFDYRVSVPPKPQDWQSVAYWGHGGGPRSAVGYPQRNFVLDQVDTGWLYFLDDDNVIHPRLIRVWLDALQRHPAGLWFIFRQVRPDGRIYLRPHCPPRQNFVDMGQSVIHRSVIGKHRFPEQYGGDGLLFERLGQWAEVICVDEEATYYNALRDNDGRQTPPAD